MKDKTLESNRSEYTLSNARIIFFDDDGAVMNIVPLEGEGIIPIDSICNELVTTSEDMEQKKYEERYGINLSYLEQRGFQTSHFPKEYAQLNITREQLEKLGTDFTQAKKEGEELRMEELSLDMYIVAIKTILDLRGNK